MKLIMGTVALLFAGFAWGCSSDSPTPCDLDHCQCVSGLFDPTCTDPAPPPIVLDSPPYVAGDMIDGDVAVMAVGGTYDVTYGEGGHAVTMAVTGDGFTAAIRDDSTIVVGAVRPGTGQLALTDTTGLGTTTISIEAAEVAAAIVGAPSYRARADAPTAYLGTAPIGAVRLVDGQGRLLADETLAVHADWATVEAERFTAVDQSPGPRTLTVSAASLDGGAPHTLDLAIVDSIDDLALDVDTSLPLVVRVCGHALRAGHEVYASWTFGPDNTTALPAGNCKDFDRGRLGSFLVTATAGGLEREIMISAPSRS